MASLKLLNTGPGDERGPTRKPGQIRLAFKSQWQDEPVIFLFPWSGLLTKPRWVISTAMFMRSVAKMTSKEEAVERMKRRASDEMRSDRWSSAEWIDENERR